MRIDKAMDALESGAYVRRESWPDNRRLEMNRPEAFEPPPQRRLEHVFSYVHMRLSNGDVVPFSLGPDDIRADDWVEA